jgi:argininosuccinate lyase
MSQSDSSQYTWAGRFSEPMSELVKRYTASVISTAHVASGHPRLAGARHDAGQTGIISADDLADIERGMAQVAERSRPAASSGHSTSKTCT